MSAPRPADAEAAKRDHGKLWIIAGERGLSW